MTIFFLFSSVIVWKGEPLGNCWIFRFKSRRRFLLPGRHGKHLHEQRWINALEMERTQSRDAFFQAECQPSVRPKNIPPHFLPAVHSSPPAQRPFPQTKTERILQKTQQPYEPSKRKPDKKNSAKGWRPRMRGRRSFVMSSASFLKAPFGAFTLPCSIVDSNFLLLILRWPFALRVQNLAVAQNNYLRFSALFRRVSDCFYDA